MRAACADDDVDDIIAPSEPMTIETTTTTRPKRSRDNNSFCIDNELSLPLPLLAQLRWLRL